MSITPQTPPETVAVSERIEQNILQTLQTITIANGYSINALPQTPNPGIGDSLQDGRMIIVQESRVKETQGVPDTMTQWMLTYIIACEVVESEKSQTEIETRRNRIAAEVEWALTYDPWVSDRPNQSRGGLAEDTLVLDPIIPPVPANAHEGQILVRVGVRYRTVYNNPFTSIYDS